MNKLTPDSYDLVIKKLSQAMEIIQNLTLPIESLSDSKQLKLMPNTLNLAYITLDIIQHAVLEAKLDDELKKAVIVIEQNEIVVHREFQKTSTKIEAIVFRLKRFGIRLRKTVTKLDRKIQKYPRAGSRIELPNPNMDLLALLQQASNLNSSSYRLFMNTIKAINQNLTINYIDKEI